MNLINWTNQLPELFGRGLATLVPKPDLKKLLMWGCKDHCPLLTYIWSEMPKPVFCHNHLNALFNRERAIFILSLANIKTTIFLLVSSNLSVLTFEFPVSFFVRPFPACVRLSHVGIAPLRLSGEVVFPTFEFWIVLKSFDLGIAWREIYLLLLLSSSSCSED